MASQVPDPKSFTSWEEAFQFPVPAVRAMEKQLRRDIEANRGKLRTLVGASYRDLLGTAESIVEMDGRMHNVETYIGDVGQKCNTRLLERKGENLQAWRQEVGAVDRARYSFTSQLAVLRSCPDAIRRILKSGGSVLLAAKVLVVSRLLHTKLSKRASPPPYLESLRNRLASLRRNILARIDRRFKNIDSEKDVLIEAMCAFALATSSSPTDVVRHFHHLRLEAISENIRGASGQQDSMLIALRLYIKTLKDTQTTVPGQLLHALEKLKAVSLFKSQDLHDLVEMNLDVHQRWIGDDIKTFTPYIRHDDLNKAEAEKQLKIWAKRAAKAFLDGLRNGIHDVQDPLILAFLRKQALELWLSHHHHSLDIASAEILDGLRDVFNDQAIRLIKLRCLALSNVCSIIQGGIRDWHEGVTDVVLSLWAPSMTLMDANGGGKVFRNRVMDVFTGKNETLEVVSSHYTAWLETIAAIESAIQTLRKTQWADGVDDVDDEDDLLDNKQVLLSEDDPRLLQEELSKALEEAFENLQQSLRATSLELNSQGDGHKAAFLLRAWREIRQKQPQSYRNHKLGLDPIFNLQTLIAHAALSTPLTKCTKRFTRATQAEQLAVRPLWEGDPELPILPSPWVSKLLLEVLQSMADFGSDVWSTATTAALKEVLILQLMRMLKASAIWRGSAEQANGHTKSEVNDENTGVGPEEQIPHGTKEEIKTGERSTAEILQAVTPPPTGNENEKENDKSTAPNPPPTHTHAPSRDHLLQNFFDTLYLSHATATTATTTITTSSKPKYTEKEDPAEDTDPLGRYRIELLEQLELDELDNGALGRMGKDAGEYWKRTGGLFGLISG